MKASKTTMDTVKLRAFLVRFIPCSNFKGSRCVIEDLQEKDFAQDYPERRKGARLVMGKADEFDGCADQALAYLEGRGIKIEHVASHPNGTLLLTRDCGTALRGTTVRVAKDALRAVMMERGMREEASAS